MLTPIKLILSSTLGPKLAAIRGSKYGNQGLFSEDELTHLNLPHGIKSTLASILNHSISAGTWSTYKTVGNMLKICEEDTMENMNFPMCSRQVIIFIHWLFEKRKVTSNTANTYLSGLRYLHIVKGSELPILRPPIVEQLLKGKHNWDAIKRRQTDHPKRAPITLNVMKLIKIQIKALETNNEDKALIWATCTIAFAGCLRIHEILSKKQREYDPDITLLGEDVVLNHTKYKNEPIRILQIKIKSPKEDRIGVGKIIDIYESSGPICPIRAFLRWEKLQTTRENKSPIFKLSDGTCLTGRKLNQLLKQFLEPHLDYKKGKFSSHSFRAGMATLMGTLGFGDEDIMAMGRWSSEAYLNYLKLPRTRRIEMARKIGDAMR